MSDLSSIDQALLETVSRVDVMDTAGKIVTNPRRAVVSLAEQLAMALAVEQLQAIAIEAELLINALALPETGNEAELAAKDHAVQTQTGRVRTLISNARGETQQEKNDASMHS